MMTVAEIMTSHPLTLTVNDSLLNARKIMQAKQIRHLPVTDVKNKLAGVVTQRDVLAAEESSLFTMDGKTRDERHQQIKLKQLMTTDLATISPNTQLREAAVFLQAHKLSCLPVVDEGELVGIITDSDFINVAINLMEIIEDQDELPTIN